MKTIDVRITCTPEMLAAVLSRLTTAPPGNIGDRCREFAEVMRSCAQYQRIVREAYEAGQPLEPRLRAVRASEALLPINGGKS